jgi:hypothetical protein
MKSRFRTLEMDYALGLSNAGVIDTMPGEQGFLNALMDAADDVAGVVFVVVMIRSELDPEGYTPARRTFAITLLVA